MTTPIILVPACTQTIHHHAYHVVQEKYIHAITHGAKCIPLILPALATTCDWTPVLNLIDGVLLTGSESNVHPAHFGESVLNPNLPLDPHRDATTFMLIKQAIAYGIPLFAICRGTQEVNVALGGSLHQAVHTIPGMMDHRENKSASISEQYAPAHSVQITPDGVLAQLLGETKTIMVNSVHGQGINRLASDLRVEAQAEDGLIEAYSINHTPGFSLAVQWHPEWEIENNPVSKQLFEAFGKACHLFKSKKAK